MKKTNKQWYFYKDMECFYKLVDGELWFFWNKEQVPDEGDPVDFNIVAGGYLANGRLVTDRLEEIKKELLSLS